MRAGTMLSIEEYERLPHEDGLDHELLDGQLLVSPRVKWRHSRIAHRVYSFLAALESRGFLCFIEPGLKLGPQTVLGPDLCVLRAEDEIKIDEDGWCDQPVMLVVEIVSLSNTADEIERKTAAYLDAGTEEVWVLYPRSRSAHIYRRNQRTSEIRHDAIDTPLFGGFHLDLPAIFS